MKNLKSITTVQINTFNEIKNLLDDKTYSFVLLQQNEGRFIGYDLKALTTQKEIENVLPIKMCYDNNIKEISLSNTERFYKLSKGNDILMCQAIKN